MALLPLCKWGNGKEDDMEQRKMLRESLAWQLDMFTPAWTTTIAEQTHSGLSLREAAY
jgi:hypothetical protein